MRQIWFPVGALVLAVSIAAGALGAHALRARLDARSLELWHTAVRYALVGGLGLLAVGLAAWLRPGAGWHAAGWLMLGGVLVFSGTVSALALGGPRWLGAITPIGGVALIVAFLLAGLAALRSG